MDASRVTKGLGGNLLSTLQWAGTDTPYFSGIWVGWQPGAPGNCQSGAGVV